MKLRPMAAWGKADSAEADEDPAAPAGRCLTLLIEGTALNMPDIHAESYKAFRGNVSRLALQIPDRLPEDQKLVLIRTILQEYECYRNDSEAALKERLEAWRGVVAFLFHDLLSSLAAGTDSPEAKVLRQGIPGLKEASEIQEWRGKIEEFLHPPDAEGKAQGLSSLKTADRSTANDNAAGLRGGGSAVAHLQSIMQRGGSGFIALFRLSCLDLIKQRFGNEAVEDCLMAVSSFLTASLHSDDAIYHWNDSSLLAILQGRPSEQLLIAELQRIASQNRDSSIQVAGRTIMLRIPMAFEVTPINRLRSAEDLYRLSTRPAYR